MKQSLTVVLLILCAYTLLPLPVRAEEETPAVEPVKEVPVDSIAFPVLRINTVDNKEPYFEVVYPPSEDLVGISITKNDKLPGRMVMTLLGDTIYDSGDYVEDLSGLTIKVRGNTTAAVCRQLPYKLKLQKKADLLDRKNKAFAHKDWVLLRTSVWNPDLTNAETNVLTEMGMDVARAVGIKWAPSGEWVNVYLNDQFRGLYYLIESVDKGPNRVDIDGDGLIVENDALWWNSGDNYFRTEQQFFVMGYTFRYPGDSRITPELIAQAKVKMQELEDAIYNQEDLDSLIDMESFVRFLIAHDLLGTVDVFGSNTYIYWQSENSADPEKQKLRMTTVWDLDSSFRCDEDNWSYKHYNPDFYFDILTQREDFMRMYYDLFDSISGTFMDEVTQKLLSYKADIVPFEQSRILHHELFPEQLKNDYESQIDEVILRLAKRFDTIQRLVNEGKEQMAIESPTISSTPLGRSVIYSIDGKVMPLKRADLPAGIYIEKFANGRTNKFIKR